ncbi:4Fe-4S binding protein [Ferviditalea candida]|uniref:4Fe-4S binding protein n=1 Tax=Ferviditalea candida TaxID=3108399 RepID=UPI00352D56EC
MKTGIYFLIFLGLAVFVTFLFERRVFCRYICPANRCDLVSPQSCLLLSLFMRKQRRSALA